MFKTSATSSWNFATSFSFALACFVIACPNSFADEKDLTEQTPAVDTRVIPSPLLNGAVRHDRSVEPLTSGDARTQPQPYENDNQPSWQFKRSVHKLRSEDFRKMEYGILGMFSEKLPFASHYVVVRVIPGCPAAEGGIRPGDVQISTNGHVWTSKDTNKTYWQISDGKAGTPVDLSIRRHGEILQFHLTRMNIEDVPSASMRRLYERMLEHFGPPSSDGEQSNEISPPRLDK